VPADRKLRAGVLAALVLAISALAAGTLIPDVVAAAACTNAPVPGSHPISLMIDGTPRTALVHVPPTPAGTARLPLVVALHGVGGSGPAMETYSGLSAVADRRGFIVAYPSSHGSFWNSTGSPRLSNDVRFIGGLIAYLRGSLCVDPGRIYVAGVSNGGGMAALVGCQLSAEISGLASVAGGYDGQPACRPRRPMSVLEIHGTADQIAPYFGATRRPTRSGVPPFVDGWVSRDRCRGSAAISHPAPRTTVFSWTGCAGGARIEHIRITRGRHAWPGATPPDPGPASTICGACAVWDFFAGLPRNGRG
jgi:polyhydroxybutyrate depolymerase